MLKNLTLLHSNDIHGDFLPELRENEEVGGVALLSGYVQKVRKETENVIYAIAGDMFRGSIIDSEFKGLSTMEILNFLQPDVMTLGNHEVDYGIGHLLFLEKCAKFPIINANLYIKSNHMRLFEPYFIKEIDGMKVLFIGILTEEVLSKTRSEEIIGSFIDIWEAREEIGVIIDNYHTMDIDCTVLLTHIGYENDVQLARVLDPEWGVDLIIGGHTHTNLDKATIVNGIPIVQAGSGSNQIGRFDLVIDTNTKGISSFKWEVIPVTSKTIEKDEAMEFVLDKYKSQTDAKYQRILARMKRTLTHPSRYRETELGNLCADLLQEDSSFDVMLMPSGMIRKEALGTIITYQDLKECLPYDESVIMLEVTGRQFRHMIKYMLRDEAFNNGHTEFYQLSKGMYIEYDRKHRHLDAFRLNGNEIEDDQLIKIGVMEGYHYNGFSEFFDMPLDEVIKNRKPKRVITSCFGVFEEMLVSKTNIDAKIEGRITLK